MSIEVTRTRKKVTAWRPRLRVPQRGKLQVRRRGGAPTYPAAYSASVSIDDVHWTTVPATAGTGQSMSIMFPLQWARFVRITLTAGSANVWDVTNALGLY